MTDVFLDTVGIIAIWDEADQWHDAADATYRRLIVEGRRLITTTIVLYECGNAAARRQYRPRVDALRRLLSQERLLIDPTSEEVEQAWAAYDGGRPGDPGIVDHVSFAVMRRLGIQDAFTNDQHFATAGFTSLF
jgi:predicted nucleic acid-binding protein